MKRRSSVTSFLVVVTFVVLGSVSDLTAHCDRMDGPVATSALEALQRGEFQRIQIWVGSKQEDELRQAFDQALAVRNLGDAARDLADRYLVETAVRLHREAEGMPFTGVKPAGLPLPIDLERAETALESEELEPVLNVLTDHVSRRLRRLFEEAVQSRKDKDRSVEAGRKWTDAYVRYIIFVHGLFETIQQGPSHGIED